MGDVRLCVERGALNDGVARFCHVELGAVRLYVLRELGFVGLERRVLGALNVEVSVRLLLALGLADAVALRPALAGGVLFADLAAVPLLRELL